jgi:hypothetical protein
MKRPRLASEISYVAAPPPEEMVRQNASLDTEQDVSDQQPTDAPVCAVGITHEKLLGPLSPSKDRRQQSDEADDQSIVVQEGMVFDDDGHDALTPTQDHGQIDDHLSGHGSPYPFDDGILDSCIGMHTVQNCRPYQEVRFKCFTPLSKYS